jgi:ribonuclease VapC
VIVVDSSAIMAVALREEGSERVATALARAAALVMSAGTLSELEVINAARATLNDLRDRIDALQIEIVAVDAGFTRKIGAAYARWGKGRHPAGLNFGDCFAYALAKARDVPLLYVGEDFARTDVRSALAPG